MITAVESANAHSTCWEVAELLRDDEPAARSRRASERLLQLAAGLPQGSHLSLVFAGDGAGAVSIRLHTDLDRADLAHLLDWVGEGVCRWVPFLGCGAHLTPLAEADPAVVELIPAFEAVPPEASLERPGLAPVLDAAAEDRVVLESRTPADPQLWPVPMTSDWMDLLTALTQAQAQVRVHLAPASPIEQQIIAAQARTSVQSRDPVVYSQYLGTPVRIRCFAGQAATMLSPRLRAVLTRFGVGLHLEPVDLSDPQTAAAWDGDETTLVGYVEPFGVASCYLKFPACGTETITCGVPTAEADIPPVAIARHTEAPAATEPDGPPARRVKLRLGQAIDWAGNRVDVTVTAEDLLLHTQVLGATGTGKSTLLAALAHQAAAAGLGVTVIESHGPLVERIVRELPDSAIDRTALVRSGDLRDSVPVNVLGGEHGELLSEVMLEVFRELYDPNSQGFLGPRFERIYSQAIAALRILFGDRASLAAIPFVIRDQKQVSQLAEAVGTVDPALKSTLISELARLRDDNFAEIAGWVNAKFNRLVSRPEMRAILGTGDDAVDVTQVMDERGILLIDLAAPTLGPLSAQLLGEMWLAKHWAALASRADPLQPHLLIVDEAHLFGSGLLPRLLAEARKFGVGVVLAHQHLEQLTAHLQQATLATTNNVVVFRSGPREAVAALTRLGTWGGGTLTRLPRLQAAATLSQGSEQSDAFTLMVDHNVRSAARDATTADAVVARVEAHSRQRYADPFRATAPVTLESVQARVAALRERAAQPNRDRGPAGAPPRRSAPGDSGRPAEGSFLDERLARRRAQDDGSSAADQDHPASATPSQGDS